MTQRHRQLAAALITIALGACGGGGGGAGAPAGPSTPPPAAGPTGTAVTATGVITGFGSIYVNGVRYDTSAAEIEFEDEGRKTEDDLRLGMRVRIEATREGETRRADRIRFDEDLKGRVTSVTPDAAEPATGRFTVAGQIVTVDGNTVFDDDVTDRSGDGRIDIRDLDPALGTIVVEVSGFPNDAGFVATRVDRVGAAAGSAAENEVEVKGAVSELDETAGTFRIRALLVRFGLDDLDPEDFAGSTLGDGVYVEVKGVMQADGSVDATRIEREDELAGDDAPEGEFEVEGILQVVDTAADPDTITINGLTIPVDDASRLAGSVGRRVEIKGSFDASGVLVLRSGDDGVRFEAENSVRVEDRVDTVSADRFTVRLGLAIVPTGSSRVEDATADDGDRLTPQGFLSRLANGDFVEARGFPAADGSVSWTRIERDEEDDMDCRLRGPVAADAIADPRFTIQGVTIDTSRITSFGGFEDENDIAIGRAAFFERLSAGDVVQATSVGTGDGCSAGLLIAEEVEFELDDGVAGTPPAGGDDNGGGAGGGAEIAGTVSNVNDADDTFVLAGRTVQVTADTLIDASIVEAARGVELPPDDLRYGDLPESLSELLPDGLAVIVALDAAGNAIRIED